MMGLIIVFQLGTALLLAILVNNIKKGAGSSKIKAIKKMLFEEITPNLPAPILQVHNDFTLIIDEVIENEIKNYLKILVL